MPIDHDQSFKRLIEAFFREFMELIDFSKVEFLREEHFTEQTNYRDLLFSSLFAEVPAIACTTGIFLPMMAGTLCPLTFHAD